MTLDFESSMNIKPLAIRLDAKCGIKREFSAFSLLNSLGIGSFTRLGKVLVKRCPFSKSRNLITVLPIYNRAYITGPIFMLTDVHFE